MDDGTGFIILILVGIVFVVWLQWTIGKAIGKHVSSTTGVILGVVFIVCGISLLIGIAWIVDSSKNVQPVNVNVNLNANVNPGAAPYNPGTAQTYYPQPTLPAPPASLPPPPAARTYTPPLPAAQAAPALSCLTLYVKNYSVALQAGQKLYACHTVGNSTDNHTVTGEVTSKKSDPSKIGIRNLSNAPWTFTLPGALPVTVQKGGVAPLDAAQQGVTVVNFGGVIGRIA
jgi:hypothetical protein